MAATGSFVFSAVAGVLTEGPLAAFVQESMVLIVFAVSFFAWRRIGKSKGSATAAVAPKKLDSPRSPKEERSSDGFAAQAPRPRSSPPSTNQAFTHAAEQQLMKHLEMREFTPALNLYRSLERDGRDYGFSEALYSSFVQSAIRVGKVDVVERMLRSMKRGGLVPSLKFWQTLLKMLSSRRQFTTCLTIHTVYGRQLPTDKVVYSCLINAALEASVPDKAAVLLSRFGEADIEVKDHVLFFRTYVALNDVEGAEAIFRKLGAQTTALMLNLLLLVCVNTKQPSRALALLQEGHALEEGAAEKMVDVVSYNTVIKGFSQASMPKECFECLNAMLERGVEPDEITFGTLLDACIVGENLGAANEVVSLIIGQGRKMDTVMCTLFIKGLVRAACLPKALELYEEMKRRDATARPDVVTYSVLIKALVDKHELDKALQLVEDMTAAGHRPDDIILTHLLEGCRHASNHNLGKKLFKEMVAAGVKPSDFTLVTMLKLHGRCGAHKEAYELVANWESLYGTKPGVIHYTCLMSGCLRTRSYNQAWAAYELMRAKGIAPDETALATLLPGVVAAQQWDKVLALVQTAFTAQPPVKLPSESLNNALSQMLAAGTSSWPVEQLQALMQRAGVPVTARNARRLHT